MTNQINTKVVTQAMMNSIDGMDIKLDCTCKDWQYRFAYQATLLGYKYGETLKDKDVFKYIDVLVDGQYVDELHDFRLKWRGSSNQRVIDMKNTLKENKIITIED